MKEDFFWPWRSFWALFKRELFAYFITPLFWVLLCVFLLVQGVHLELMIKKFLNGAQEGSPIQAFFGETALLYFVLFLFVPSLSMRLLAEERKQKTIEHLLTAPISIFGLVMAKYLSACCIYTILWIPTLFYVFILRSVGGVDLHVVASSYIGVLLIGYAYLSIGLWMSSLTKSQLVSFVLTAFVMMFFFMGGMAAFLSPDGHPIHELGNYISLSTHQMDFSSGVIDTRKLLFDVTLITLPIFFTVRTVGYYRVQNP